MLINRQSLIRQWKEKQNYRLDGSMMFDLPYAIAQSIGMKIPEPHPKVSIMWELLEKEYGITQGIGEAIASGGSFSAVKDLSKSIKSMSKGGKSKEEIKDFIKKKYGNQVKEEPKKEKPVADKKPVKEEPKKAEPKKPEPKKSEPPKQKEKNEPTKEPVKNAEEKKAEPPKEEPKIETIAPKTKLSLNNFPAFLKSTKKQQKSSQKFADAVNSAKGADPRVVELYSKMDAFSQESKNSFPKSVVYSSSDKASKLSTSWFTFSQKIASTKLTVPDNTTSGNEDGKHITMAHEMAHYIDLISRDGDKCSFSSDEAELTNAIEKSKGDPPDSIKERIAEFKKKKNEYIAKVDADRKQKLHEVTVKYYGDEQKPNAFADIDKYNNYAKEYNKLSTQLQNDAAFGLRNMFKGENSLEDIYGALKGERVGTYGHSKSDYYGTGKNHEIFADYMAMSIFAPELVEVLRADKPELCTALDNLIDKILKKA